MISLEARGYGRTPPAPFPINANALRLAWERFRKRADLSGLRFHDLSHAAMSRFFKLGLSNSEVALISGHENANMLFRCTQLKTRNLITKLG